MRPNRHPWKAGDDLLYFAGARLGWVRRKVISVTKVGNPRIEDPLAGGKLMVVRAFASVEPVPRPHPHALGRRTR